MELLTVILSAAIRSGTPVLYATLGEVITERAGIMNLGLEGIMLVGAYAGFAVTKATGDPWLGILAAFGAGCLITVIHAFLCITMMCNQVVSGLAMVLAGYGLSNDARPDLGLEPDGSVDAAIRDQAYQGSRYSFGYAACPDLGDRTKLVALLRGDAAGEACRS